MERVLGGVIISVCFGTSFDAQNGKESRNVRLAEATSWRGGIGLAGPAGGVELGDLLPYVQWPAASGIVREEYRNESTLGKLIRRFRDEAP